MGFQVQGKVAVVTGSNRGIGAAIVRSLIKHGAAKVYAGVRKRENAKPLVDELGSKVVPLVLDLSDEATVRSAAKEARDAQLVINNAGVLRTTTVLANEVFDSLNYEFDVNVYGLVRMIREFVPVLEANGGGAFVQLNSVVSVKSFADFATYSASKAAAYSLTQALRDSLAGKSIQVMSVHPGPIMTDMGKAAGLEEIAEPASVVSEAIVTGLADGSFHVFPDSYAKNVWQAYEEFAKAVVEAQGE